MAARTDLKFDVAALDRASQVFTRLGRAVENFEKRLERLDGERVKVDVEAKTEKAERQVGEFARKLQRDITRAVEALPDIELDADATPAQREVQRIRGELQALADQRLGIDIDATEAHARAQALERDLRRLGDVDLDIQMRADVAAALGQLAAVNGEVDRLDGRTANVRINVDRGLADTIVRVAALGRALGTLAVPASLAASVPTIAQLGAAVVTATGALGVIPAAGVAAAAAVGALTVALHGMSDAFDDDPKKAAEALKQLAPAARETVAAIRGFAPAWNALRLDVQQKLFGDLASRVQTLGRNYLPILRTELGNVAGSFSAAAEGVADMLNRSNRVADLRVIFGLAAVAVQNLTQAAAPLAGALVDITAVGAGVFADLTSGARDAALEFAGFIATARQSGDLARWMQDGVEQVKQLGRIAGDTGGILLDVFSAAEQAGGGVLDTLERLVQATRDWTSSVQGQDTIAAVFRSIREAVDAAAPGVAALVDAISSVIQRLGDAGVLRAAGEAFSAIAQNVAPLVTQLGNLAPVVTALLGVVRDLAPVLTTAGVALAGFWAAAKVVQGVSAVSTAIGGFATKVRDLGTAMGESKGVTGKVRTLAGALGAGGILGIALGAAGLALGLWAQSQADAERAVADHKAAVDELKGSLDQYSGAATNATRAQVAQELGAKKLSDGTTSYASALSRAGVTLADFTDATTGNEQALLRVRGQLDTHVASVIKASPAYQRFGEQAAGMGISLQDLAAAAQGNGPAMDRINAAVAAAAGSNPRAAQSFHQIADALVDSGRGAGELGVELNKMAGIYDEAAAQQRDAASAARDFATTLDTVKAGFAGLATGAPQTELMRAGLIDLATAARTSAQAAGENAKAYGGVDVGAKAAADSMAKSREAFISAATGAGMGQKAAEDLATSIGLVPTVAETTFRTNATGVQAEILGVKGAFDEVPGAKEIVVQTLTDDAIKQLEGLGFTVERLPDGTVRVTANTDEAHAKLGEAVAAVQNARPVLTIDGNIDAATGKITQTVQLADGSTGTVTVDARPDPATGKVQGVITLANGSTGTVTLDGNPDPATGKINATVTYANGSTGTITLNPRDNVTAVIDRLRNPTSSTHTIYVNTVVRGTAAGVAVGTPAGGGVFGYAGGGFVDASRFARAPRSSRSRGMVIPGYAPGRDDVPIVASRGESVLVPELTRALGARRILAANAAASGGRPATVIGKIAGLMDGTIARGAAGGWVPDDDSFAGNSYHDRNRGRAGFSQAEDGSWVRRSFYSPSTSGSGSLGSLSIRVRRMAGGGMIRAEDGSYVPASFYRGGPVTPSPRRLAYLAAMNSHRQAPSAAAGLGPVAELRAMLGQLRALRGDVDQSGFLSALVAELRGLRRDLASVRGSSYADTARDAGLLGGASWR